MIARGGPPVWNHTKWGKFKMALESKGKEGRREKSLATIEMESCYLRGEGGREGEFAELKRSPATDRLSGWSGSRR